MLRREAVVELLHGPHHRLADRSLAAGRNRLQSDLDRVRPPFVGELGERGDCFDFDFAFGALQQRQQVLDVLLIADFPDGANHGRQGFRLAGRQHLDESRQRLGAADLGERIDRALAHPPVGVLGGLDQLRDRALVLGLVQDLDGRAANVLILILDQCQDGIDDLRTADLAERVGRASTHPPIAVGDDLEQVFDRLGGAHHVQYLDRRAPRVFILVLEHLDQVLDGLRVIGMYHEVDGLVLHFDLRVAKHAADQWHVERAVHARKRRQRRRADQFVVVLEQLLHGLLYFGEVEARQDLDDVQPCDRILPLDSCDQLVDRGFIGDLGDDLEEAGAFAGFLGVCGIQ